MTLFPDARYNTHEITSMIPESETSRRDESERLDTWDQIAFHLNVTRATAQRWEKEGLPVHRHQHAKLGRVFAYKSELEAWALSRTIHPTAKTSSSKTPQVVPVLQPWHKIARWKSSLILLLFGALGIGFAFYAAVVGITQHRSTSRRIMSQYGGVQETPDVSADGTQVAFAWDQGNPAERHIFVAPVRGGPPRRLTAIGNSEIFPRWSPDGQRIAFGRYDWQGHVHLTLIDSRGGGERTLAETQPDAPYLAWTPDGRSIVFTDRVPKGSFALFRINIDSGERRQLTTPPPGWLGDLQFAISPDGQRIAVARFQTVSDAGIYGMPASGGTPRRLTHDDGAIAGVTWPELGTIFYSANRRTTNLDLWSLHYDQESTSQPVRVAGAQTDVLFPSVSFGPKRTRLTYQRCQRDTHIFVHEQQQGNEPAEKVIGWERFNGMPAVSPNRQQVAFVSDQTGHQELYIASRHGEHAQRITDFEGAVVSAPSWAPSGRLLAFSAVSSGFCGLYQVETEGKAPVRIFFEQHACGDPTWSRDGNWLYFRSMRSGSAQIWKIRYNGEDLHQLTLNGGFEGFEATDGDSFYYIKEGGPVAVTAPVVPVYRMPVTGGAGVALDVKARAGFWTVVNTGILFLRLWEADAYTKFYRYEFATGRTDPVFAIPARSDRFHRISASPDGSLICWDQLDRKISEVFLFEDWR